MTLFCPGPSLVDLPTTALQDIAKYFQVDEWAQGPCQTCRLLYNMQLPCMDLMILYQEVGPSLNAVAILLLRGMSIVTNTGSYSTHGNG
jgi:hypothetical protein